MELDRLANNLQFAIPKELYLLEPNKVFLFVPKCGVDAASVYNMFTALDTISYICQSNDTRLNFFPTDNEALIDKFASRIPRGTGEPDKVVISSSETLPGFVKEIYGKEVDDKWDTPSPIIIDLDPKDSPVKESVDIGGDSSDDSDLEVLQKRPETDKEKKEMVTKYEQKVRKILWECAYLGIDIDLQGIANEVEINKTKTEGYELSLQMERNDVSGIVDCKIFVGDGLEMKVTAVRKAVYLAFLTLEDGLVIESATPSFTKRIQNIYRLLPDREEKEEEEGGLLYVKYIQSKTLRGYMSNINAAIAKLIPNGLIAIEFGIEGEQNEAFKVRRSTPEIRKQIIEAFNL